MKWRCERCGRPHERNDPPCDDCGYHAFEKAVVPVAPEGDDEPLVWVCTECGRSHPRNNPPCSRCGNGRLQKEVQSVDDPLYDPGADGGSSDGPAVGGDETTVWACTECGRAHPRNSPPCSRCGHMQFEREVRRFDDAGTTSTGWIDVLDRRYVLGFVGAFVLLGLVLATTFGLIGGPPTVENVPGDAETADGIALSAVEDEYVAALDERRAEQGLQPYDRPETLQEMATYYNQRRVKADYGDGDPPVPRQVFEEFDYRCERQPALSEYPPPTLDDLSGFDSASELGRTLALSGGDGLVDGHEEIGVDVHAAPDGTLYVTVFLC